MKKILSKPDAYVFNSHVESAGTEECTCKPSDGEAETGDIQALLACRLSLTGRSQDPVSKLKVG